MDDLGTLQDRMARLAALPDPVTPQGRALTGPPAQAIRDEILQTQLPRRLRFVRDAGALVLIVKAGRVITVAQPGPNLVEGQVLTEQDAPALAGLMSAFASGDGPVWVQSDLLDAPPAAIDAGIAPPLTQPAGPAAIVPANDFATKVESIALAYVSARAGQIADQSGPAEALAVLLPLVEAELTPPDTAGAAPESCVVFSGQGELAAPSLLCTSRGGALVFALIPPDRVEDALAWWGQS